MILEKFALALRSVMLRTARSPLKPLWSGLYSAVARGVAVIVAPRRTQASVYLTGSLAGGEPVHGVSDIDLVAVAADADEARRVRRRFEALGRALPPLRRLVPHFFTYDERGFARVLAGPYPVNGLDEGLEALVGPDAPADEAGLLERPGLHGIEWRRLRGSRDLARPPSGDRRVLAAWLELQYRWRWGLYACATPANVERPALGLVVEAARIWLWLARGERHDGRAAPLERALRVMDAEEEGLRHALEIHRELHRSPPLDFGLLFRTFTSLSGAIARLVDGAARDAGATEVALLGAANGDGVPMADWRALALPELDWSSPEGPRLVEQRLEPQAGDPGDPAAVLAAAARDAAGRVPVMRVGSLLVEPTLDPWGRGRLRTVQCPASDPVSFALLDGRASAAFPDLPGWSARDWAGRAVAEHRAWLAAGRDAVPTAGGWIAARPPAVSDGPATVGLLLSAARAALLLESVESGRPTLPLTLADVIGALAERDPGVGADAAEATTAPSPAVVERLRRQVESLPAYFPKSRLRPPSAAHDSRPTRNGAGPFAGRRGANISHWLAQTWWMTREERARGFTREDAERLRELGLDHVRLPVDEHCLWHADGSRDARGFELLETTVEWCRAAGLGVVVASAGPWRDLADLLGSAPTDAVAYELADGPELAEIRQREPERTIVLGGGSAVPTPPVPSGRRVLLGFRYYEPALVTHYRASWLPVHASYAGPIRYPGVPISPAALEGMPAFPRRTLKWINRHHDGERVRHDLAAAAAAAQRTGHPVYCREFGVLDTVPDPVRLRWYRDVIDALEESEIAWSAWDLKGRFGLYRDNRPTVAHRAIAERRFAE
jgi:endoglucanase